MWFQKPPIGTPLDWGNPFNKDLALHLAMNEGHGDVVRDLSMNGNHGTLNGFAFPPTVASGWNPGQTGVGLNFDGTDDYINCGNNASLDIVDKIAINCWVKRNDSNDGTIITKLGVGGGNIRLGYRLSILSNKIKFEVGIDSFYDSITGNTSLYAGIWYNIIVTHDGSYLKIYLNGNQDQTPVSATQVPWNSYGGSADIGKYATVVHNGIIDQFRIHTRAPTAKEANDYYINPWQVYLDE